MKIKNLVVVAMATLLTVLTLTACGKDADPDAQARSDWTAKCIADSLVVNPDVDTDRIIDTCTAHALHLYPLPTP